ncbi:hypothetical protein FSP39_022408 [Pinctada imbricata]|uniref:RING-type domain-containing protein n=1 Tax=Pinctada imbricata TaxID=66713 RepID=A0AA88Y6H8_PINIB|nr:hypothetical protein FSP39_022408 [Pinctada imbricata]
MVILDKKLEDIVDGKTSNKADCSDDNNEDSFNYYRAESYRLETFQNWPKQSIVTKEDLARHGFYYLKSGDRVKCAFCNVVLRDWAPGDNVETEHKRHSKRCPLVLQGLWGAQNIPYDRTPSTEEPAYPQYADYNARLKTYEKYWPKSMKQRPRDLAAAGFFYLEKGDAVRCFQCAGLLRNWEPNDIPWEEHKRFFPRCTFLQQNNISPRRGSVHHELVRRQVSREYDPELVKKFEEYRVAKKCLDEVDARAQETEAKSCKTCVKCSKSSQDHHTMIPCNCICCEKCVEHIIRCPSCNAKIRAALSIKKGTPRVASANSTEHTNANAKRQLNFNGPSCHGLDE